MDLVCIVRLTLQSNTMRFQSLFLTTGALYLQKVIIGTLSQPVDVKNICSYLISNADMWYLQKSTHWHTSHPSSIVLTLAVVVRVVRIAVALIAAAAIVAVSGRAVLGRLRVDRYLAHRFYSRLLLPVDQISDRCAEQCNSRYTSDHSSCDSTSVRA